MVSVLLFTALIVVLIFLYMRHKTKSSNSADIDSVRDYHAAYDRIRSRREMRNRQDSYQNYRTKYNSSEDYRERDGH